MDWRCASFLPWEFSVIAHAGKNLMLVSIRALLTCQEQSTLKWSCIMYRAAGTIPVDAYYYRVRLRLSSTGREKALWKPSIASFAGPVEHRIRSSFGRTDLKAAGAKAASSSTFLPDLP